MFKNKKKNIFTVLIITIAAIFYVFKDKNLANDEDELNEFQTEEALPELKEALLTAEISDFKIEQNLEEDRNNNGFKKQYFHTICEKNCLSSLLKQSFNPTLISQLIPIKKRLIAEDLAEIEILYADYWNNGKANPINSKIFAVRTPKWILFAKHQGTNTAYFFKDGSTRELQLDRYPLRINFKITSPFNLHRRHPITKQIRPHYGVDLSAPRGSSIHSVGDAIVTFAGRQSGYGLVVILQHNDGYETRYAHLDKILVQEGQRIKRGTVIGLLGNSGLSTAPHLHYEIRIDGNPHNPVTVKLPNTQSIKKQDLSAWQFRAEQYLQEMEELKRFQEKEVKK